MRKVVSVALAGAMMFGAVSVSADTPYFRWNYDPSLAGSRGASGPGAGGNGVTQPALQVATATPVPPSMTVGATPSSFPVVASGGMAPVTITLTGTLPSGMSFQDGVLSGSPKEGGTYTFGFQATDSSPVPVTKSVAYTVTVDYASPVASLALPATLPQDVPMAAVRPTVSGGRLPLLYGTTGTLPPGLKVDAATGEVTGTPTTLGAYVFALTVSDASTPRKSGTTGDIGVTVASRYGAPVPTATIKALRWTCGAPVETYIGGQDIVTKCTAPGGYTMTNETFSGSLSTTRYQEVYDPSGRAIYHIYQDNYPQWIEKTLYRYATNRDYQVNWHQDSTVNGGGHYEETRTYTGGSWVSSGNVTNRGYHGFPGFMPMN